MKRLMAVTMPLAAALAIAACGSSGSTSTPSAGTTPGSGSAATTNPAASGKSQSTVSLKPVSGIGNVVVDHAGMAVYNSNQEPNTSKIVCTASAGCTSFWKPLLVSGGKPAGSGNVGKLGTFQNPEGDTQVTINGVPVYTFVSDSAGKVTGNNYKDQFNGASFHWHVLIAGGKAAPASAGPSGSSSGSNTSTSGGGGGYGY